MCLGCAVLTSKSIESYEKAVEQGNQDYVNIIAKDTFLDNEYVF